MRKANRDRIISMAVGVVPLGRPGYLLYIASKAPLIGMSRSMARELGLDGLTVNLVLPGAKFTEIERETVTPERKERIIAMQCIPRAETPEDLADIALFVASKASAYITGQVIKADGGTMILETLAPCL